jgi:hypothetical protein
MATERCTYCNYEVKFPCHNLEDVAECHNITVRWAEARRNKESAEATEIANQAIQAAQCSSRKAPK